MNGAPITRRADEIGKAKNLLTATAAEYVGERQGTVAETNAATSVAP